MATAPGGNCTCHHSYMFRAQYVVCVTSTVYVVSIWFNTGLRTASKAGIVAFRMCNPPASAREADALQGSWKLML